MRAMRQPILIELRKRLKAAGPAQWPGIAASVNELAGLRGDRAATVHSLRKLAYGDRDNPGLQQVQALMDHFGMRIATSGRQPKASEKP